MQFIIMIVCQKNNLHVISSYPKQTHRLDRCGDGMNNTAVVNTEHLKVDTLVVSLVKHSFAIMFYNYISGGMLQLYNTSPLISLALHLSDAQNGADMRRVPIMVHSGSVFVQETWQCSFDNKRKLCAISSLPPVLSVKATYMATSTQEYQLYIQHFQ